MTDVNNAMENSIGYFQVNVFSVLTPWFQPLGTLLYFVYMEKQHIYHPLFTILVLNLKGAK